MISFEKISVYQEAIQSMKDLYALTKKFPKEKLFGLIT